MASSIYEVPVRTIGGTPASLAEHKGKVILVVNVASKCGLTSQYEGLESLYCTYRDRGFVIAAFPANDFASQEPGTNEEIQSFCTENYAVDFPLYEKITVVGAQKHPLYSLLITAQPKATNTGPVPFAEDLRKYGLPTNAEPELLWNFEKFLISRSGQVVARFAPDTKPDDPALIRAIESELNRETLTTNN